MIPHERLRTPAGDGEVLVEPPIETICAPHSLPTWVRSMRASLQARLGLRFPLVITGHQCELFHAGVFAKTLAARRLADVRSGDAAFLHVDSDTPKSASIRLPTVFGGRVTRAEVRLPAISLETPIELQSAPSDGAWGEFFNLLGTLHEESANSPLRAYADGWLRAGNRLSDKFAGGHHATQHSLGIEPLVDLTMSALAATPEFNQFVARLFLDANDVAAHYNAAQACYRRRHRVRNPARPVAPLEFQDGRVESPLWALRRDGDRLRHRVFVARQGENISVFADRRQIAKLHHDSLNRIVAADGLIDLEGDWLIRPRALTLSGFCRLALADVFIHGIGGAKYDEVTNEFMRNWLDVELPPLLCVTATMRLPAKSAPVDPAPPTVRDVHYNPQRALKTARLDLVRQRAALIAESDTLRRIRAARRDRRRVFDAIRAINREIVHGCAAEVAELDAARRNRDAVLSQKAITADREVFFAMHSRAALTKLNESICQAFGVAAESPVARRIARRRLT